MMEFGVVPVGVIPGMPEQPEKRRANDDDTIAREFRTERPPFDQRYFEVAEPNCADEVLRGQKRTATRGVKIVPSMSRRTRTGNGKTRVLNRQALRAAAATRDVAGSFGRL